MRILNKISPLVSWADMNSGSSASKGRILRVSATLFDGPTFSSRAVGHIGFNSIVDLVDLIQGEADSHSNTNWYKVAGHLFLHGSNIQPVEKIINPVQVQVSSYGQLAKVSVPFTQAWKAPLAKKKEFISIFYGSNHWVKGVSRDESGMYYYKIEDDRWEQNYFVQADHLYLFPNEELRPIQSNANPEAKRLEVDLNQQSVAAYENEKIVFQSPISSGFRDKTKDYSTPPGEYRITLKRPSRHMTHSDRLNDADTDLFGVPWMCNFTDTGIAFHGTYWHNEFTYPHSHGCVNLPIEAARWVYLWSDPAVPPREPKFVTNHGTRVIIR